MLCITTVKGAKICRSALLSKGVPVRNAALLT
jgi:hypothetical protein